MRRLIILLTLFASFALAAAACGGDDEPETTFTPIPGNSELIVGANRFAVGLIDKDNQPVLEAPGTSLHLRFFFEEELAFEQDAGFTWAIPDVNGFWVANIDFDQAGTWEAEAVLTRDGDETKVSFVFPVLAEGNAPAVGDPAPPTKNLTLQLEPNVRKISTDEEPDPAFYQMNVAQALQAGRPFVVVFATPAFCQTQFCGPVVENVREVKAEFAADVNFIHIEPYGLDDEGQLLTAAGGGPVVVQAMDDWHLQTEPWVFVVDADGGIAARFEGAASPEELRAAIEAALG